jgi:hypothetical protein
MDAKLKHLEFIQNIITRMASNSFLLKGWSITIVSALFALAAKDSNRSFVIVSYLPICMFWVIDGFFIAQEKAYRKLYAHYAEKDESDADFCLDASNYYDGSKAWAEGILSKTLVPFHGVVLLINILVMFFLPSS